MTDSEGEIECLDEDIEIVQKCMEYAYETKAISGEKSVPKKGGFVLIVDDKNKKRKITYDDDSDYEPSEERPMTKKRKTPHQKIVIKHRERPELVPDDIERRKRMEIIIPDLEDPLCLPVKAVTRDSLDENRLKNWNNTCIARMREIAETVQKDAEAVSTTTSVILRNTRNRLNDKVEVTMKMRTITQNKKGGQNSEVVQCFLPRFREKKELTYWLTEPKQKKYSEPTITTAILTKECNPDEDQLIVYKLEDAVSAVYSMVDTPEEYLQSNTVRYKRYLLEKAALRSCAACSQASRRPTKHSAPKAMNCAICGRHFVSVYNYLTHLKGHNAKDVSRHAKFISKALASVVQYHYKCFICRRQFPAIKYLRNHVKTHKSTSPFLCEIGNHLVK